MAKTKSNDTGAPCHSHHGPPKKGFGRPLKYGEPVITKACTFPESLHERLKTFADKRAGGKGKGNFSETLVVIVQEYFNKEA